MMEYEEKMEGQRMQKELKEQKMYEKQMRLEMETAEKRRKVY